MIRNLKALGLALVAVFAMSAMAASGAQALKLTATAYPATLTGEQVGKHKFEPAFGGQISCEVAKFAGTIAAADKNTEITIRPTYEKCHMIVLGQTFPATVEMTHCDYLFTGGVEVDAHNFKESRVALECPLPSETPHIKVYNNATHTEANRRCEFTVTQFLKAADKLENTYKNETPAVGKKDVLIKTNVAGVKVDRTFGTFGNCGLAEQNATYTGETTLKAYQDLGDHLLSSSPTIYQYTEGEQYDLTVSK